MEISGRFFSERRIRRSADLSTFVSVGNAHQPFGRLLEAVRRVAARLPQPVVVQHGYTPFDDSVCSRVPFLGMEEFIRHVRDAELLIMHAGAGSVIHAVGAGKIPVIMPRHTAHGEHVNDHQVEFAQALAATGKVVAVENPDDLERAVEEAMTRQRQLSNRDGGHKDSAPPLVGLVDRLLSDYARDLSLDRG
jgi:UDP-N-acetylglucosamine transferase subunit ALG13